MIPNSNKTKPENYKELVVAISDSTDLCKINRNTQRHNIEDTKFGFHMETGFMEGAC
jgi:hypothetical protein